MKKILIFLVKIYQNCISPIMPKHCRFTPSCSEYAVEAIKVHGSLKGCWLAFKRILRCNPLNKNHGYDPVEPKDKK